MCKTRDLILAYCREHRRPNGALPAYREIARALSIGSTSTVSYHIHSLLDAGELRMGHPEHVDLLLDDGGRIQIGCRVEHGAIRLCGEVHAEAMNRPDARIVSVLYE